jgi:hypothetical protein
MQLRACLGFLLLGLTACESLPALIRFEIDGSSLEFKKKPEPPASNLSTDDDGTR